MANAYITNDYSTGQVAVLNTATNTVSATISVSGDPIGIALSPDGSYAYTANENNFTVGVINLTAVPPSVSYINLPSGTYPQYVAVSPDGSQIWVSNIGNNTVSVISGGSVTHTISLSGKPGYIAFTPDGNYAYVPVNATAGVSTSATVNIYSTGSSPSLAHTVSLSYLDANGVAISEDGSYAYVTNFNAEFGPYYLVVIATSGTPSIYTSIAVGSDPWAVAVRPNANEVYVLNQGAGTVSVIDTATNTVTATIDAVSSDEGYNIAFTSDGIIAFVANVTSAGTVAAINAITHVVSNITVYPGVYTLGVATYGATPLVPSAVAYIPNSGTGTVYAVNTITSNVIAAITVETSPIGIAYSPGGQYVFVANYTSGTVSVISTVTGTVIQTITVGTNPFGIAVSPSGNYIYVTNQSSNSVSIITIPSFTVTTITTGVGSAPTGVAVTPNNAYFYVTNYSGGTVSVFMLPRAH